MSNLNLTQSGLDWLMVNIASEFGKDKLDFSEQIQWTQENSDKLEELEYRADNTFAYAKAVKALRQHQRGEEVHYVMPVDASNQALQLYGVLSGDLTTANLGSVGTGKVRVDAYQRIATELNEQFNTYIFSRNNCKKALMVTLYGSSNGAGEILSALQIDEEMLAKKLNVEWSEDFFDNAFQQAMLKIAPYCMSVMDTIQSLNNAEIGNYKWTLPDGFKVSYDVKTNLDMNIKKKSRTGKTFSVTLTSETYMASEYNKGMAPNVIHSVDGYVLRQVVRKMGDTFITTIHDSYSVHPNEVDKLRKAYAETISEVLESNLLQDIMCEIAGKFIPFKKETTLTRELIMDSTYSLA